MCAWMHEKKINNLIMYRTFIQLSGLIMINCNK